MITYTCDHCKEPITDVAYILQPQGIGNPRSSWELHAKHLHYKCLVPFVQKFASSE